MKRERKGIAKRQHVKADFTTLLEKGLRLSFKKLVKAKQQNNAVLFFSENGRIIKVKAKDIKVK